MGAFRDLTGDKYNRLTVLELSGRDSNKEKAWVASWSDGDKKHTKNFSDKKYGDLAQHLAVAYREKMMEEVGLEYGEKHGKLFELIGISEVIANG